MCPHERVVADGDDEADMVGTEEVVSPEEMGDPLDEFAVAAARRRRLSATRRAWTKVSARHSAGTGQSRHARRGQPDLEAGRSCSKAGGWHGESGVSFMAAAMAEHARKCSHHGLTSHGSGRVDRRYGGSPSPQLTMALGNSCFEMMARKHVIGYHTWLVQLCGYWLGAAADSCSSI